MKYCCENFQWRYTTSDGMGLNIRVAQMKDLDNSRSFFITEGYQKGATNVKNARIKFCPFCGVDLKEFYMVNKDLENSAVEDFLG